MTDPRNDERDEDEPTVIQPDPPEDDDGDFEDEQPPTLDGPYSSEDFHNVTHKLVTHAVTETLRSTKMDWDLVAPFLESAREMTYADFQEADVRIHTVRGHEGDIYVEAEEAYLGFSVADRDTGEEWLSATYWFSELAIEEDDPEQVRRIIAALERSLAKMRAWVSEKEAGGASQPAPPANGDQS